VELLTIRQAAKVCGIGHEALRRRVDRGTIRAAKGRDGVRRIPRAELERAGLWPGVEPGDVALRAELEQTRRELVAVAAQAAAERQARERAELAQFQAHADAQAAKARQQQAEARAADLEEQLQQIAQAGPIRALRLRRQLRHGKAIPLQDRKPGFLVTPAGD